MPDAAVDPALLVARLLFATMFLISAGDKFRGDKKEIAMIAQLHLPAPARLETLTGVCEVLGAAMLLTGAGARIAAAGLLIFTAFISLAFLQYWKIDSGPEQRLPVRNAFFANVAVVGGLLYIVVVGPGRWAIASEW